MEIIINDCYGGFGLSLKAKKRLAELMGKEIYFYKQTKYNFQDGYNQYIKTNISEKNLVHSTIKDLGETTDKESLNKYYLNLDREIRRNNPYLIQVVKELGLEVNGTCASLKIVEIPDDINWEIEECDGSEWISEKHQIWR